MSILSDNPPLEMGTTYLNGDECPSGQVGSVLYGIEYVFNDYDPCTGRKLSDKKIRCRCVRNSTERDLKPLEPVVLDSEEYQAIGVGGDSWIVDKHVQRVPVGDVFYATLIVNK